MRPTADMLLAQSRAKAAEARSPAQSLSKQTELEFRETVADLFRAARSKAQPFGDHGQATTQLCIALLEVISNFPALK
jgi:hypothetical protein